MQPKERTPDYDHLQFIESALARSAQTKQSLQLFETMQAQRGTPVAITHISLTSSLAKGELAEQAE